MASGSTTFFFDLLILIERPRVAAAPPSDASSPDGGQQSDGGCGDPVLWFADHETGDLSQYTAGDTYGGSFDSDCTRPPNGVVSRCRARRSPTSLPLARAAARSSSGTGVLRSWLARSAVSAFEVDTM